MLSFTISMGLIAFISLSFRCGSDALALFLLKLKMGGKMKRTESFGEESLVWSQGLWVSRVRSRAEFRSIRHAL